MDRKKHRATTLSYARKSMLPALLFAAFAAAGCGAFKKSSDAPVAVSAATDISAYTDPVQYLDDNTVIAPSQPRNAAAIVSSTVHGGITCTTTSRTFWNNGNTNVSSDYAWITPVNAGWPAQYVTVTFTLSNCSEDIEAFYYNDLSDSDLLIKAGSISVKLNGVDAAYSFETSAADLIYAGMEGHRFILDDPEQPPAGSPHTVIPAGSSLVIAYTVYVNPASLSYPLVAGNTYKKYIFPNYHWSGITPSNKIVWSYDDTHADTIEAPEKNCNELPDPGNTYAARICADNIPPEIYAVEDVPGACSGHSPGPYGIIADNTPAGRVSVVPNLPNCRLELHDNAGVRAAYLYTALERTGSKYAMDQFSVAYLPATGNATSTICTPYQITTTDTVNVRYYVYADDQAGLRSYWSGTNYPGTSLGAPALYTQMPYFTVSEQAGVDNFWSASYRGTACNSMVYDGSLLTGWVAQNKNRAIFGGTTDWVYVHHFAVPTLISSVRATYADFSSYITPDFRQIQISDDNITWTTPAYTEVFTAVAPIYKRYTYNFTVPQTANYVRILMGDAVAPFSASTFFGDLRFF